MHTAGVQEEEPEGEQPENEGEQPENEEVCY